MTKETAPSSLQRGRLALLSAGILWSVGGVFIKQLPVGPVAITFYRSRFAALALLILAGAGQQRGKPPPVRELTVSSLLFAGLLVTFVAATRLTTGANAIILQYAQRIIRRSYNRYPKRGIGCPSPSKRLEYFNQKG